MTFLPLISDKPHSGYGATATTNGHDNTERLGLMTYKQFTQVLEDDVSPAQAGSRYQEYRTEYITTQKRAYFDLNKNEDWLKDMYHPTKLLSVIESGPGVIADAPNKSGDGNNGSSEDDADYCEKERKHGRGPRKERLPLSAAPKAHPVSSQFRRIQADIVRTLALVKKLDSEKDIVGNILLTGGHDKSNVDKSYATSMGPVVIVRGLNIVKGLEGVELLDTLLTYLWRVHGVDYYGMSERKYAKGFRHVRAENKSGSMSENISAADWEKKLDSFWEQRLMDGEDPLVVLTAKDKIDAAIVQVLKPYVRKMRDEKYVWKYGCGAKGCEKLFHAPEYVHKHLRLKHRFLVSVLASRIEDDIYYQNYMNDPDAPGGKPVMQQRVPDRMRRRPDEQMYGASGRRGSDGPLLPKLSPPLVLIPVPGAGLYGPFVPAPPEMAMQMMQKGLPGPEAAQHRKPSVLGPTLPMYPSFPLDRHTYRSLYGPFVPAPPEMAMQMMQKGLPGPEPARHRKPWVLGPTLPMYPSFPLDRRTYRSYEDLDAPKEEIAALDLRRL
ncbi:unnamed protein product [Urochloa decumbens]|uniref:C2H2-type domain-containing protein n=1 Tax=Urochloa decumbens TaxID=240449 RepID=A0ABC9CPT8_9POAL